MFKRKYILGETGIVVMGENEWGVRNPKSKNDFVGVWARQKHLFAFKKNFPETLPPLIYEKNV